MHMSMGNIYRTNPHSSLKKKKFNIVPATPEILVLLCYSNTKLASPPSTPRLLTLQYNLRHGLRVLKPACGMSSPLAFIL